MNKWFAGSLGLVIGVTHMGLIGLLVTRQKDQLPSLDIPVGDYTSYVVSANKEGYKISYTANDPKTAYVTKDIKEKAGFLGLATNRTQIAEQYFMDGKTNQGAPVSNQRS